MTDQDPAPQGRSEPHAGVDRASGSRLSPASPEQVFGVALGVMLVVVLVLTVLDRTIG